MVMDYNAYKQDRVKAMLARGGGVMSDKDRQMLNNNMANEYRRYAMQQMGGVMSDKDLQTVNNFVNKQTGGGGFNIGNDWQMRQQEYNRSAGAPADTLRQQQMLNMAHQLEGGVLSEKDLQRLQQLEPLRRQQITREYLQANGGVLSQKDLEALNKVINNRGYEMPTYQDIYNGLTNLLNGAFAR